MKTSQFLSTLILTTASLSAQDSSYEFFLDQRNLEGDGFIRTSVIQEDSMPSAMPVPEGGSEFILWAVQSTAESPEPIWTQIGSEVVGAYLPQGELEITTGDPYDGGIPRTRIDQPFFLNY